MPANSHKYTRELNKIGTLLTALRSVNPTMSIQVAHTLLLVAQNPGASLTDLAKSAGFVISTMSRNLLDLGARNRKRGPGYGLVMSTVDDQELRRKHVNLTPKGEILIQQLINIIKV